MFDTLLRVLRAPIWPLTRLVLGEFCEQAGGYRFWRVPFTPCAVERQRCNVHPFLKIRRSGFDLREFLADMRHIAVGPRSRPECGFRPLPLLENKFSNRPFGRTTALAAISLCR